MAGVEDRPGVVFIVGGIFRFPLFGAPQRVQNQQQAITLIIDGGIQTMRPPTVWS